MIATPPQIPTHDARKSSLSLPVLTKTSEAARRLAQMNSDGRSLVARRPDLGMPLSSLPGLPDSESRDETARTWDGIWYIGLEPNDGICRIIRNQMFLSDLLHCTEYSRGIFFLLGRMRLVQCTITGSRSPLQLRQHMPWAAAATTRDGTQRPAGRVSNSCQIGGPARCP